MNFDFSDREEAFRKEVRGWLEANLPDDLRGRAFAASRAGRDEVRKLRAWQKRMCEAGYVGLDWPREFGGRGATIVEHGHPLPGDGARGIAAVRQPRRRVDARPDAHEARHAGAAAAPSCAKILTADEIWCQGFSEPNAGSDLANLQTRGVRDGDHYVVNGQKVWTSMAHVADWCFLLVRTDPTLGQAQGHQLPAGRHEDAGHHGAAAAPDHGRGGVQRGLLRQRAGAGREPRRRSSTKDGASPSRRSPTSAICSPSSGTSRCATRCIVSFAWPRSSGRAAIRSSGRSSPRSGSASRPCSSTAIAA